MQTELITSMNGYRKLSHTMARRRLVLLLLIAVTAVIPALFIQLDEPTATLLVFKVLAKLGSLLGTILLLWQFVLGFRGLFGRVMPDVLWQIDCHKRIGQYGLLLILLHPIFISVYYLSKFEVNIWLFETVAAKDLFVVLGMIALALLLIIVATSQFLRGWLGPARWYIIHLSSYLVLPLIFIHSYPIGMTIETTALRYVWPVLGILYLFIVLWRILFRVRFGGSPHEVKRVTTVAEETVEIMMRPLARSLVPQIGQFVYFRQHGWDRVRPYTVTSYDPSSGCLAVAIKAQEDTSVARQNIQPGEQVVLDGPYGVFTWEALAGDRTLVMIAGGIGITSFMRVIDALEKESSRETWLFYGNQTRQDIAFKEHLEAARGLHLVHVLSDEPEYEGETGFVTRELLEKYLSKPLVEHEFLLCGPPVMINKLEAALQQAHVPDKQIHHELFGY